METPLETIQNLLKSIAKEQKYEDCNINIKKISTGGANYTGCLFSAVISATGKDNLHLFAKVLCIGEELRKHFSEAYRIETFFYSNILKSYRLLEDKYDITATNKLRTPEFYGCNSQNGNEALVLEDLTVAEYKSFDRLKCLTWEQTTKCVDLLAKFHALSLALSKENPKEYEEIKQKFVSWDDFFKTLVPNVKDKVIAAVEENDKYRIDKFIDEYLNTDSFSKLTKPITKEFIVHGDYRPSNLMYKIVNGECQVIALDLQTLRCGSPTFDLIFFINLGINSEMRKMKYQEILDLYYDSLCTALRRFRINPSEEYSRQNFEYDLKSILPYAVLFTMCLLLVVKVDEDVAPHELDKFDMKDFGVTPSDIYKKELKEFIAFYSEMGVIPYY